MGGQWHLTPKSYLATVRAEIPRYDELQGMLAGATAQVPARRVLDLGAGTGFTARRLLEVHPGAEVTLLDESAEILELAAAELPSATCVVARLQDPLPEGGFDVIAAAFSVHHLDAADKRDLFARVASALNPSGRFAMLDVVVPVGPVAAPVAIERGVDLPSSVAEMSGWLLDAGLGPRVVLEDGDLAVLVAERAAT